jgi:DNA-binding NarL/FixJ family response regulator
LVATAEANTAVLYAGDPISRAGVAAELAEYPDIVLLDDEELDSETVVVAVCDALSVDTLRDLKRLRQRGPSHIVLVVPDLSEADLLSAVEAGVVGVVRRAEASGNALADAIRAVASGNGSMPPDLLGRLLERVHRLQEHVLVPHGLSYAGLTERELGVLRLVAEGLDTHEIAARLCYSERTIKSIIHDLTGRLHLRNRSHAVAFAMREGLL